MGGTSSKLDIAAVIVSNNADKCNHSILWLQQQNTILIVTNRAKSQQIHSKLSNLDTRLMLKFIYWNISVKSLTKFK